MAKGHNFGLARQMTTLPASQRHRTHDFMCVSVHRNAIPNPSKPGQFVVHPRLCIIPSDCQATPSIARARNDSRGRWTAMIEEY